MRGLIVAILTALVAALYGLTADAATANLTIVVAAPPPQTISIWTPSTVPGTPNANDGQAIEVGTQFTASQAGQITALRFYKGTSNTGTHVGSLWSSTGTLLAQVTYSGETASGWQQQALTSPVTLTAGTTYVASVHSAGTYAKDAGYFATAHVNSPLTALANSSASPGNGLFLYTASSAFPTNTFGSTSYYADVVFSYTPPPQTPTGISFNPASPITVADTNTAASTLAAVTVSTSNGLAFPSGDLSLTANAAGRVALSGNNIVPAHNFTGADDGSGLTVTVQASENGTTISSSLTMTVAAQNIASVSVAPNSFTAGVANGVVGALSVPASPAAPLFSGTMAITGTNSGGFHLSSTTLPSNLLQSAGGTAAGTYTDFNIVATQANIANSPFTQAMSATGTTSSDPAIGLLPTDRDAYANWKMAGRLSVGGIPAPTQTVCNGGVAITPRGSGLDDTSAINTAIGACPAGQVLSLASGTFTVAEGNTVSINKGVVVRGAGPSATILARPTSTLANCGTGTAGNNPLPYGAIQNCGSPGQSGSEVVNLGGGATITNTPALSSDGVQGSYTVNVASTTGISVGSLVLVDELALAQSMPDCCFNNGTGQVWAMSDYRVEWNAHSPEVMFFDSNNCWSSYGGTANNFSCDPSGDPCAYSIRCGGVQEELHLVTAINGNTLTFDSPLTLSYRVANSAQVHVYSSAGIVQNAGLENLAVKNGDNGNIIFSACVYCWVKSVESTNWLNAGGVAFYEAAFRDQAEFNWIHTGAWPVNGGGGYATNHTYGSSENYVVNNIVMLANKMEVVRSSGAGTVIAYNYMDDGYINGSDSWIENGLNCSHLAGSHDVLHEGNYSFNTDNDFTHGSSGHCAFFRNYLTGFRATFTTLDGTVVNDSAGCCSPQRAISDHAYSYWDSFIGNVAGVSGQMTGWNYRCAAGGADSGCAPAVFNLGWNDTSVSGSIADGTMELSYPTVPTGANATITGPGCVSSGFNCAPIVDGNFDYLSNSIQWATNDTAHTLPNSLYLTSQPAFFTGGSSTWPPVDPINGVVHNIPAHARWANGTPFTQP